MDNHPRPDGGSADPRPTHNEESTEVQPEPVPGEPDRRTVGGETVHMGEAVPTGPIVSDPEVDYPPAPTPDDDPEHHRE